MRSLLTHAHGRIGAPGRGWGARENAKTAEMTPAVRFPSVGGRSLPISASRCWASALSVGSISTVVSGRRRGSARRSAATGIATGSATRPTQKDSGHGRAPTTRGTASACSRDRRGSEPRLMAMRRRRRSYAPRASTSSRGYGHMHQQLRKRWALEVATGQVPCARCGELIRPDEPWDLGHDDHDRSKYTGPEHRACNRATNKRRRTSRLW
jgi:hypothetical protein